MKQIAVYSARPGVDCGGWHKLHWLDPFSDLRHSLLCYWVMLAQGSNLSPSWGLALSQKSFLYQGYALIPGEAYLQCLWKDHNSSSLCLVGNNAKDHPSSIALPNINWGFFFFFGGLISAWFLSLPIFIPFTPSQMSFPRTLFNKIPPWKPPLQSLPKESQWQYFVPSSNTFLAFL